MSAGMRILMVIAIVLSLLPADLVMAADWSPMVTGIKPFGPYFAKLAQFEEFGKPIPMSNISPGEALHVQELFTAVFNALPAALVALPYTAEITTVPDTQVTVRLAEAAAGAVKLQLVATRTMDVPILYASQPTEDPSLPDSDSCQDGVDNADADTLADGADPDCAIIIIDGGEVKNTTFTLAVTLTFQMESGVVSLVGDHSASSLHLTAAPSILLTYTANDATVAFESRYGFADVTASGAANYNAEIDVYLNDENSDGKISTNDLNNTILVDLVDMKYVRASSGADKDVEIALALTSALWSESPGASQLTLIIPDLGVGLDTQPTLTASETLTSFTTIGPDDMLIGLASYAYALNTAWVVHEGDLPFIQEKLHNLFMPGNSLLDLVKRQGDALVLCGTNQTIPPTGKPDAGGTLYCQAYTSQMPYRAVAWRLSGADVLTIPDPLNPNSTADARITGTIGIQPTDWAVFTNVAPGEWKNIEVEFEYVQNEQPETHLAEPRIRSVNELREKLEDKFGTTHLVFDAAARTLIYEINSTTDPQPQEVHLAFGGDLRDVSGLVNVRDDWNTAQARASVNLGPITINAGFGTILVPDVADISPDAQDEAAREDRFFIAVPENNEPFINVDTLTITLPAGGYTDLPGTIGALEVAVDVTHFVLSSETQPLSINLADGVIAMKAHPALAHAVGVKDLIAHPATEDGRVTHTQDMGLEAALTITSQGLNAEQVDKLAITWPDVTNKEPWNSATNPNGLQVYFENLAVDPLTLKAFDLRPVDPATPENPQALLTLILDSLYNRVNLMYIEAEASPALPVVGQTLGDLAPQFQKIMNAAVALKTGKGIADIYCDPGQLSVDGTFECWARSDVNLGSGAHIQWTSQSVELTVAANGTEPATIWPLDADPENDPSLKRVKFKFTDQAVIQSMTDFGISLTINDQVIEYPYRPPETLHQLRAALAEALGIAEADALDQIRFNLSGTADNAVLEIGLTMPETMEQRAFRLQLTLGNIDFDEVRISAEEATLSADVTANFNLDYALPLQAGVQLNTLAFKNTTRAEVNVEIAETDFPDIQASLGGYALVLGNLATTSAARPGLSVAVAVTSYATTGNIQLDYTVTNTGNFTLLGEFTVTDGDLTVTCLAPGELEPTASFQCSAEYPVSANDLNVSALTRTAQAQGYFGLKVITSPEMIYQIVNENLPLELTISASSELLGAADSSIAFTYTVKNIGNTAIDGPFTISDSLPEADCATPATMLAAGATDTCAVTHVITAADHTAPDYLINTASASDAGVTMRSGTVTRTVTPNAKPSLGLTINVTPEHLFGMPGNTLKTTYQLTNTGNVSLAGPFEITLSDATTDFAPCSAAMPATLAPGQTAPCATSTHTVTTDEWAAGEVQLEASARINATPDVNSNLVTKVVPVTDISKQASVQANFAASLSATDNGAPAWAYAVAGNTPGADVVIALAARTAGDESESLGVISYRTDAANAATYKGHLPSELSARLQSEPLDASLFALLLPELKEMLKLNLDGDRWNMRLPMLGSDLAAGVQADLNLILDEWTATLAGLDISNAEHPKDVYEEITTTLNSTDFEVEVYCQSELCNTDDSKAVSAITKIQIVVADYQPVTQPRDIPFETGLPGLPLESTDAKPLTTDTNFTLNLTFGVDQLKGPYVAAGNNILKVSSKVSINAQTCPEDATGAPSLISFTASPSENSKCRYMNGYIGLFPGKLYDGAGTALDDKQSRAELTTTVKFERELTYEDLLNATGISAPVVAGTANINLLFITDSAASSIPLPRVAGTIHLSYANPNPDPNAELYAVSYKNIYMNVATFYQGFLGPALNDVRAYTKPFQPVVDTVTAPIPVISDIATMVGGDTVTLLDVLDPSGTDKRVELVRKLAALISYINQNPSADESWIGLGPATQDGGDEAGSFEISIEDADEPECGEGGSGSNCESEESNKSKSTNEKADNGEDGQSKSSKVEGKTKTTAEASWEGAGITVPILEDTSLIYGMLLGEDATLIHIDLGTLEAKAGLEYSFGPIMVGPVPITITVGGTITLTGRFAMGYDTRGLRQLLRNESWTGSALIDGVYIDDLDLNGADIPEIVLEVDIYAGAAVSIKIFEAGIQAGVKFTVSLNWNDPNKDGKLRIDEIGMWMSRPICLFDRHGTIGFYLKFYVEVDLFLFKARAEWTAVEKEFDLFDESCSPPTPVLGQVDGGQFWLNIGTRAAQRNLAPEVKDEKFTVRQLTALGAGFKEVIAGATSNEYRVVKNCDDKSINDTVVARTTGTCISISFLGVYQEYIVPMNSDGTHHLLRAEAAEGHDTISLLSGVDKAYIKSPTPSTPDQPPSDPAEKDTKGEIPFTLNSALSGGTGNDQIDTGQGVDVVDGGPGNDIINTRSGDDTIIGGPETLSPATDVTPAETDVDSLDGGIGDDVVLGGAERDVLNGGPGSDVMDGGPGDDTLSGGPGLPLGIGNKPNLWDAADILIGNAGDDMLEGTYGADYLFGDQLVGTSIVVPASLRASPQNWASLINPTVACAEVSAGGRDKLIGGADNDHLFGGGNDDQLQGDKGNDVLCGNTGHDVLAGGSGDDYLNGGLNDDDLLGGEGHDILEGSAGNDILLGDTPTLEAHPAPVDEITSDGRTTSNLPDHLTADMSRAPNFVALAEESLVNLENYNDILSGGPGQDFLFGETGDDFLYGDGSVSISGLWMYADTGSDDYMEGNSGTDIMDGNDGADTLFGGQGDDYLYGGKVAAADTGDHMWGNSGEDRLWGHAGNDEMNGNTGEDILEGNQGADTIHGGPGADRIIGGTSAAGKEDDGDTLYGDEDNDLIAGDNALFAQAGGVTLYDLEYLNAPVSNTLHGKDTIQGNDGEDRIWGQGDDDTLAGNTGDDYIEGNSGADTITGGAGADDLSGGTYLPGILDLGDTINGDAGRDRIAGDNALIRLTVKLLDVETLTTIIDPALYGGDLLYGDEDDDQIWGQGGADKLWGGAGADYIEGNHAFDVIYGEMGTDVLIGGSNPLFSGLPTEAYTDTNDLILGGAEADLIAGDNAWFVGNTIVLLNVETQLNGVSNKLFGGDTLWGGDDDDHIWGQGGEDYIGGGNGDDYIEGNHASDVIHGDAGQDDILGGGSPDYVGAMPNTFTDVSTQTRLVPLGQLENIAVPLGDTLYGDAGADMILGDNGSIENKGTVQTYLLETATFGDVIPQHALSLPQMRTLRIAHMLNTVAGFTAGSDLIYGGAGEDELYGQWDDAWNKTWPNAIGDEVYGDGGQDLILGDQGAATSSVLQGEPLFIRSNPPFLKDVILLPGALHWVVALKQSDQDGDDRLSGGSESDFMHAGGGADLMNGNAGNDRLFGDDGHDALWGGADHDHLWGGAGNDFMDVLPRTARVVGKGGKAQSVRADPREWWLWATPADYTGIDYMYGGFGQDAMQADVAPTGPAAGDRMVDWIGVYNIYYLCGPQYGEYVITRSPSPSVVAYLIQLAEGDGALAPDVAGSSGFAEIALVYHADFKRNSHPPHPDTPGHFTCP